MDVLVLGGSVFLGRAVVAEALALGAAVTVFNRGTSASAPEGVTQVRGDRTEIGDLEQLRGRHFDVVVDTCGYVPVDVRASAELLAPTCGRYAFVSTINAFPGWPDEAYYHASGTWDGDPDATRDDVPNDIRAGGAYGWLKIGCERAATRAFGADRTSVLRAGCIAGPHDSVVGRLPWWVARVARGGQVLVPGGPADPVALIDARDLARFALTGPAGVFECGGPAGRDTRDMLMAACRDATGSDATLVWVDSEWLNAQGVDAWTEIPLWVPESQAPGLWAHDNSAAADAGLTWRPLAETVADVWAWQRRLDWTPGRNTPGLAPAREAELMAAWRVAQHS